MSLHFRKKCGKWCAASPDVSEGRSCGGAIITGVFEDIWWEDIEVYFLADDGRISLTDQTIDGISFDDYIAKKSVPADTTAYASTQTVSIDGNPVTLEAYALKDENGNPTNYVKLRDVAYVLNGTVAELAAISLTDDNGGGYTYYQLRDLGRALGFNVGWSGERGIFIETDKPYTDAD